MDLSSLDTLAHDVHKSLALLERDFPVSLHVSVFHLLHHLPMYIEQFGPVYSFWMYPFERFNSWMIRRTLNRRYPEATVLETYRLFDWAHFLECSGQLPEKALLHPERPQEFQSSSDKKITLNDGEVIKLKAFYRESIPEFNDLCLRYEEEKRRAKVQHRLRQFPSMSTWTPLSGPLLSCLEEEMRTVSREVLELTRYIRLDGNRRKVLLTSQILDTANVSSSFIFVRQPDNSVKFGQIKLLFQHCFCGTNTIFASVTWFSPARKDIESGLLFVDTTLKLSAIVPVDNLCGPIVTSLDNDHLWILSMI